MAAEEIRRTLDHLAEAAQAADAGRFHKLLETSRAEVREYLMSIELEGTPPAFTASYVGDALQRFLHTLSFVPLPAGGRILELGGNPYFFHILLRRIFPGSSVEAANFFDHNIFSREIGSATHRLRSPLLGEEWTFTYPSFNLETVPRYPLPPASFDLIFFCETLEHLVVNPLAVFRKIRRLLAPGGHLVITLPNAVRMTNLALMLDGYNFFDLYHPDNGIHGRHNREFTLDEMKRLLTLNGLAVRRAETRDRFDYDQVPIEAVDYSVEPISLKRRRRDLVRVLEKAGGRLDDRGDNLYLLAQRPAQSPGPAVPPPSAGLAPCPPPPPPSARVSAFVDVLRDETGQLSVLGVTRIPGV